MPWLFSFYPDNDDDNSDNSIESDSNGRSNAPSPGPWFDRILGNVYSLFVLLLFSTFAKQLGQWLICFTKKEPVLSRTQVLPFTVTEINLWPLKVWLRD